MHFDFFINFDGNCRAAVEFYAKVFKSEATDVMTYSQAPPGGEAWDEADKDKVMYAGIPIGGGVMMFMDMPSDSPLVVGNNINPTMSADSKEEVTRIFNELKEGGEVYMELQKTFFSEWYGSVKDKFGIIWHILYYALE